MANQAKISAMTCQEELEDNIDKVLGVLKDTMLHDISFDVARKLVYWLNDWAGKYLPNERSFNYESLIYYERGNVLKAELGFKIGSEDGGLHYCLVVENNNAKTNRTIMVVPLTSLDDDKSEEDIDPNNGVFLGRGIFKSEIEDYQKLIAKTKEQIVVLTNQGKDTTILEKKLKRDERELRNLNKGSVAKINQLCALSKMRIVFPKSLSDRFAGFKLAPEKLNEIDDKIRRLYLRQEK